MRKVQKKISIFDLLPYTKLAKSRQRQKSDREQINIILKYLSTVNKLLKWVIFTQNSNQVQVNTKKRMTSRNNLGMLKNGTHDRYLQ